MTFADAAVEVLRLVGRPMHFKKITQVAIAKNLLSHVGKTPEVTMSARLAAAVTKDRGSGPIVRTKAGIFALRDWGDSPPNGKEVGENDALPIDGADDSGRGGKAKAKGKVEESRGRDDGKKKKDAKESKDAKGARGRKGRKAEAPEEVEEEAPVETEGRATTPESGPPAAVAAAAAADEGADEGEEDEGGEGLDDGPGEGEAAGPGGPGGAAGAGMPGTGQGRRRRRRRRRRGGERVEPHVGSGAGPIVEIVGRRNGGTGETPYALSARGGDISAPPPEPGDNGGAQAGSGAYPVLEEAAPDAADADLIDEIMSDRDEERELIPGLAGRPDRPERTGRDRHDRDRGDRGDRGERSDRGPDRGERRDERRPMAPAPAARPDDTLADGAYRLLFGQERTGGVPVRQLADQAVKAHMLPADSASPWMVIGAALRADIQRRVLAGSRPRFRALSGGRWGLFEWGVGGEAMRLEAEAASVADRQREAARRTLLRRIVDMGDPQFEHLVLLLVDRLGYDRPRRVTRPNAHRELHLAASSRVGPGGVTVALVFARSGREIDAARITELRGALHHYGAAMGWVVTTGSISAAAREEAGAAGAPPIGLTDGAGFARLFEETGVGLVKSKVELSYLDVELLDALKSGV